MTSISPRTTTAHNPSAGKIVGVFGLHGECKIHATRIGAEAFDAGLSLRAILPSGEEQVLRVRAMRTHKGRPLLSFADYDDATAAEALVGATLVLDPSDVELAEGEYLDADLIGCNLVDERDGIVGEVVDVAHYPAQDMLLVGERRALVPLVAAFVKRVDVAAKRIDVALPAGLLDDRYAERG